MDDHRVTSAQPGADLPNNSLLTVDLPTVQSAAADVAYAGPGALGPVAAGRVTADSTIAELPAADLPDANLPVANLTASGLPAADPATADLPAADLPIAHLAIADLPTAPRATHNQPDAGPNGAESARTGLRLASPRRAVVMPGAVTAAPRRAVVTRRAALLLPLAASACSLLDSLTDEAKKPLSGNREPVLASVRGLTIDSVEPVTLPPVVRNADWLQYAGSEDHVGANFAGGLTKVWSVEIGQGGNYRARLTAQPLVAGARVYTMDTDAVVAAFDVATGHRAWSTVTKPKKARNSNIGGGIAIVGNRLYAVTGRAQVLAMDLESGHIVWHADLTSPARSAPLVADGALYVVSIDQELQAFSLADGKFLWAYQATAANTGTIGQAAPAAAGGVLVAGFESGDLAALRTDSGTLVWTDNMGGQKGQETLSDFGSVRGAPVIDNGLVYAIGLGGLMAALDIRSGRRVWQRDVPGANTPWIAGGFMFVVSTDQKLAAISKDDGSVHWVTDLPRFQNPKKTKGLITWFGPTLVGGKLILVSDHAKMAVVDATTGALVTSSDLSETASTPASVAQGTVLVLTDDAKLTAYK